MGNAIQVKYPYVIEKGRLPPINKGGRPIRSGRLIRILDEMEQGDSIWNRTKNEASSFRCAGYRAGIKLLIVKIEGTGYYTIVKK